MDEKEIIYRFRLQAATRHDRCPRDGDHAGWLAFMQHYGLPTRLLDWSKSPFVAAHNAVADAEHHGDGGVIWALNPRKIWPRRERHKIFDMSDRGPARCAKSAFAGERLRGELPYPVYAREIDLRMAVQQSVFTMHSNDIPLDALPGTEPFLTRYKLTRDAKEAIWHHLRSIGITGSFLYPDLPHLADEIERREWRYGET